MKPNTGRVHTHRSNISEVERNTDVNCQSCGKKTITSHHKCSGCRRWVGRCCLTQTEPANLCRGCA